MPKKKEKTYKVNTDLIIAVIALIVILLLIFIVIKSQKPKAIASVNNETITQQDLDLIMKFIPPQHRGEVSRQTLIEQAIAVKLINQEAQKRGISVTDEEIEGYIQNSLKQFNKSEDEFKNLLNQQGITFEDFKIMQKQQLITANLINQTIMQEINITEQEVKDFYEQYKTQINASFEEVKDELKNALAIQRANNAFLLYLQQLRAAADIKIY